MQETSCMQCIKQTAATTTQQPKNESHFTLARPCCNRVPSGYSIVPTFTLLVKVSGDNVSSFQLLRDQGSSTPPAATIASTKLRKSSTSDEVSCGGTHFASTCADCPQREGASWCNGDCVWLGLHYPRKTILDVIGTRQHSLGCQQKVIIPNPVQLEYVDATGDHTSHPHKGAMDENDVFGYVHNETALFNDPPSFKFKNDDERNQLCQETGDDPDYAMLTKKLHVDIENHNAAQLKAKHGLATKKVSYIPLRNTTTKFGQYV